MGNWLGLPRTFIKNNLWSKHVCVEDGKMKMVCCKVCSQIEGREKNLVPKFDSSMKHYGLCKCTKAECGVVIGQLFFLSY